MFSAHVAQVNRAAWPKNGPVPGRRPRFRAAAAAMLLCLACAAAAAAMDQITLRRHGKLREVEGRVELTGQDDSILLLARDGVLWSIMPDEIVKHTSDEKPYQALSVAEMTREMKGQLPKGFEVYETTHYLIFHSTSRAYAHWCGTLLERLYTAFHTFWTRKGFDLAEPDSRLVAVIFADEASYRQYLHAELGGNGGQIDRLLQPAHQPREHVRSDRHPKRRPGQSPGQQRRRSTSRCPRRTRCGPWPRSSTRPRIRSPSTAACTRG